MSRRAWCTRCWSRVSQRCVDEEGKVTWRARGCHSAVVCDRARSCLRPQIIDLKKLPSTLARLQEGHMRGKVVMRFEWTSASSTTTLQRYKGFDPPRTPSPPLHTPRSRQTSVATASLEDHDDGDDDDDDVDGGVLAVSRGGGGRHRSSDSGPYASRVPSRMPSLAHSSSRGSAHS